MISIPNMYSDLSISNLENDIKEKGHAMRRKKKASKEKKVIVCRVEFDCELRPLKPIFFPEFDYKQEFDLSVVTAKDIRDIH